MDIASFETKCQDLADFDIQWLKKNKKKGSISMGKFFFRVKNIAEW